MLYLLGDPQDPEEVWRLLSNQFQKKTWANKLALRRKLHGLRLKDQEPVQEHIKKMVEVFDELADPYAPVLETEVSNDPIEVKIEENSSRKGRINEKE